MSGSRVGGLLRACGFTGLPPDVASACKEESLLYAASASGILLWNVSFTAATYILPVDLQAYLTKNALILAGFHGSLGDEVKRKKYSDLHEELCDNLTQVFWNKETGMWGDYDGFSGKRRPYFYISNVVPLWAGCTAPGKSLDATGKMVVDYLDSLGMLKYPGGLPVSNETTGEQWDFPNAWTPMSHLVFEALLGSGSVEAEEVAIQIAEKTVLSGYEGFMKHGAMYEKYDATAVGQPGGGGEYVVQKGFGWTNGAILDMILRTNGSLRLSPITNALEQKMQPSIYNESPSTLSPPHVIKSDFTSNIAVLALVAFIVSFSSWLLRSVLKKRSDVELGEDFSWVANRKPVLVSRELVACLFQTLIRRSC
ncbi:unnamed protein product [Notodromas monacha]|uniref:Trehalase n=1 Tax=Notodromas monacha TaxID=399045 RepID=A0A7R9C235_9CRUS|nr:unnamed protein product [Notodromas monacha]CAG0924669.1 unnamed protein product [Notodromas monacha]